MAVVKTITIREDQEEWLEKNYINLSKFVRVKLDEEIAKRARAEREGEREGGEKEDGK